MQTIEFSNREWIIFAVVFLLSGGYVPLLQLWYKRYPQSYESLTWFQVVIGVGYVLLGLGFILTLDVWLRVCAAFFFASIPIVIRSIFVHSRNQAEAERG